ncbi:MAG: DUF2007 domain-containing protein [Sneathiella sp.]
MIELVRMNDPVLISYIMSILEEEGIGAVVLDEHTSVLEGSIGAIQRRIMVLEEDLQAAKRVVEDLAPGELKEDV